MGLPRLIDARSLPVGVKALRMATGPVIVVSFFFFGAAACGWPPLAESPAQAYLKRRSMAWQHVAGWSMLPIWPDHFRMA
jgi:hypothetical protein